MSRTLAGYGEDRLVRELIARLPRRAGVIVGPGDDCALVAAGGRGGMLLLKTDAVVEGVHFARGERARLVGWKAMGRCLSDVAAMGGTPEHALVTVAAPGDMRVAYLHALFDGIARAARAAGVSVVGGETVRSPGPLFVSVALTGRVRRGRCALRSGGRPGDRLYVTGRLGGSAAGRHLRFVPRLREARWLTERYRVHAMMDLSDGLAKDLPRLAASSGVDFEVDPRAVPRARGSTLAAALGQGEDYELLFAVAPRTGDRIQCAWRAAFPRVGLACIGRLVRGGCGRNSGATVLGRGGYDHFQ